MLLSTVTESKPAKTWMALRVIYVKHSFCFPFAPHVIPLHRRCLNRLFFSTIRFQFDSGVQGSVVLPHQLYVCRTKVQQGYGQLCI